MSDYIEVLDETDPGSILDGDTLIHTDKQTTTFENKLKVTSACVPAGAEMVTCTVTRRRKRARLQLQTAVIMVPGGAVVSTQLPGVFISTCRICGGQSRKLAQSRNMIPPCGARLFLGQL